jgi:nitroreductase
MRGLYALERGENPRGKDGSMSRRTSEWIAVHEDLAGFTSRKRETRNLGALIGITLAERDAIARERARAFQERLEVVRAVARRVLWPQRVDGSPLGFTLEGDTWIVHPDGGLGRTLACAPELSGLLARVSDPCAPAPAEASRRDLLEAGFLALWMPSATNWQPMRVVELRGPARLEVARAARLDGAARGGATVLVLLRRDRYESLLGDVMAPFGLSPTAHEEWIDSGLYEQSFALALASRGCGLARGRAGARSDEIAAILIRDLEARGREMEAAGDRLGSERKKVAAIVEALRFRRLLPDGVFAVGAAQGGARDREAFERLVLSRASERVASPHPLEPGVLDRVIRSTFAGLSEHGRDLVRIVAFPKGGAVPEAIGRAMHEALYGVDGEGGFLGAFEGKRFREYIERSGEGSGSNGATELRVAEEVELKDWLAGAAVPAGTLGSFLAERLEMEGRYRREKGAWVNDGGRPVPAGAMVRILRNIASVFGRFFLRFADTHPVTMILLARSGRRPAEDAFRAVGRAAAHLVLAARSYGLTSVVKTGPLDLAGPAIAGILSSTLRNGKDAEYGKGVETGEWTPALLAQIGLPLAGSDWVGSPEEGHNGLQERMRDRRPPRADSTDHFVPDIPRR